MTIGTISRAAISSGYTAVPSDDTAHQITEGAEIASLSVLPVSTTSTLKFTATLSIHEDTDTTNGVVVSFFKAGTSDAIQTHVISTVTAANNLNGGTISINCTIASHGLTTVAYTIRAGENVAGTGALDVNKMMDGTQDVYNLTDTPFICEEVEV